eukprot:5305217-Alexandrium_andersonii.AAC.1
MSASLVGSEMCIRDSLPSGRRQRCPAPSASRRPSGGPGPRAHAAQRYPCLLYTSDAADDM